MKQVRLGASESEVGEHKGLCYSPRLATPPPPLCHAREFPLPTASQASASARGSLAPTGWWDESSGSPRPQKGHHGRRADATRPLESKSSWQEIGQRSFTVLILRVSTGLPKPQQQAEAAARRHRPAGAPSPPSRPRRAQHRDQGRRCQQAPPEGPQQSFASLFPTRRQWR